MADDASCDLLGVFVQDEIPLLEDRLEVVVGGRYNHAGADANRVQDPFTGAPLSMSETLDNMVGGARQDRLSSGDLGDTQRIPAGGTPGYEVFHLRAGWEPWSNTQLTAALENLTNADYRVNGSGSNEPGLNLMVGAAVRF